MENKTQWIMRNHKKIKPNLGTNIEQKPYFLYFKKNNVPTHTKNRRTNFTKKCYFIKKGV